ncbi:GTPase Der [Methylacidimicrobium cyclopophantes]|uniref:GTPase Der n=1 Tax=Methylacidimicrobium cyclopophantes TaxID=1041766 RepID=A0A5E6MFX8_9BACT|nr:ribosome biogenesis GTPase Der [Methylacidimicrobium cyclopophantes]VVM04959.1 GTPase Der [Methylacidimicrobium cyclopophantes]
MRTFVIVGRPNVGKSTLFNRLCGKEIALAHPEPGMTRDPLCARVRFDGKPAVLIDTGGFVFSREAKERAVADLTLASLRKATDLLFVLDGRSGITPLDREIAALLRKLGKKVWVIANKIDEEKLFPLAEESFELGFGEPIAISAAHNRGIRQLRERLTRGDSLSAPPVPAEEPARRIAILGRPNVGKSTLVNALVGESRLLVAPEPGTTHDAVDIELVWRKKRLFLIDTAGLAPRRKQSKGIESKIAGRSLHALARAHVAVLVLDGYAGITRQDKKIAGWIQRIGRPCVIALNKWDLLSRPAGGKEAQARATEAVKNELPFLSFAPVVPLSAKDGANLDRLLETSLRVDSEAGQAISTGALNRFFQKVQRRLPPPASSGKRLKIYYAVDQAPRNAPAGSALRLHLFVNDPRLLMPSYERFLEAQLRNEFPLLGRPIHWSWRKAEGRPVNGKHSPASQRRKRSSP